MYFVLANSAGNLYWKDTEGHYLGCNNTFAKIAGLSSPEKITGKTNIDLFSDYMTVEEIEKLHKVDNLVITSGKEITIEEYGINEKKQKAYYLSKKIPLTNNLGQIIGIIGISIDISKQKEAEQLKQEFIGNVMHDIRTPFVGVLGVAELLWHKEKNPEKKEYLSYIMESAKKLLDYNNEILDFSRYDANHFEKTQIQFNCKTLIEEVTKMNMPAAMLKNIELSVHIDLPDKKNQFIGNAALFKRILINLVGNAIKFTKSGYVKIIVTFEQESHDFALMKLVVEDSGIGIPKESQEIIFDKFVRLSQSCNGLYPGIGLGLTIVKKLVEIMRGTIEVKSELGKGSVFICKLPFALPNRTMGVLLQANINSAV